ncbi:MAG TPA: helix-turn-helix domain-containing protein [Scandinavium sp.]|jgi:DNA-binding XRE family transcriptional regulator|uniref:helix-turn-helix domain-containing protein n=1 Tax=Scandinavium sp. TaxID=2830653 RepID=UPI002E3350D1|nr:helix-turn-helix domain-containing protein [Scandinavium sp.]HEX4501468.1 helix-turn-helix domain-containing protein [Scandinavium sp.]
MNIQFIKDEKGNTQYVVVPYHVWFNMMLDRVPVEAEGEENNWEEIPSEHDEYDGVPIPHEVARLMDRDEVSLQAAWRLFRGLSQQEVADKLGVTQSAISQLESPDSRPQKRTREKLAAIYGCTQEQISLYLPKEG